MTTNEIRKKFLEFFRSKGHSVLASDSLVPKDDPTVLFTTAGMQQFKKQFLGHLEGYTRAATSQKCLRTDDLDRVGKTPCHHTFFEMLGNFSFGDYFKKEAITWAWEFFTQVLKVPGEKLWVSVYREDDEAYQIWLNDIKVPAQRIVKLGDKSNFWPSEAREKGPNGPCGPCSEIFFDYGVNPKCPNGAKCDPDCDCGRFTEVWNLVFTQFNRKEGGVLEPLPAKNIDTGMGLERLASVLQGKRTNFETDLFEPIFKAIDREIIRGKYQISRQDQCVIADHIRAVVFAINDGVIPSNKERGSVVKRLINDSTNIVLNAGVQEPSVHKLVPAVVEAMQTAYPEIKDKAENTAMLIKRAEEAFVWVRKERVPELKLKIPAAKTSEERGFLYFQYRDTFGLPLPVILGTAELAGTTPQQIQEDMKIFQAKMTEQKERSRASSKMSGDVFADTEADLNVAKTDFRGYDEQKTGAKVLKLLKDDGAAQTVSAGDEVRVILDRTPFYAESGGQIGDSGWITGKNGKVRVLDTQKKNDVFIHSGVVEEGTLNVGDGVDAVIDHERRLSIMRNHTATHLLQAALRKVLGTHVQQQGSLVAEDRLRFDFTHPQAITKEQIAQIEEFVNSHVLACDGVDKKVMPLDEAKKLGALAFFAEKYGSTVRVVSIGNYSKEFCGGTHLDSTGQIGLFKVTGENAIAQGIRRLEARTGTGAMTLIREEEQQLEKIADIIKAPVSEVVDRVQSQTQRIKQLEKDLEKFRFETIKNTVDSIVAGAEQKGNIKIVTHVFKDVDIESLRKVADLIKQKAGSAAIVLGAQTEGNAFILASVTDDLVKLNIKANEIIQKVAPVIGGSGGGRPQMAQAGSKDPSRISDAIAQAGQFIRERAAA